MKKSFLVFALLGILFSGCEKDEDDDNGTTTTVATPQELIVGTWKGDVQNFSVQITGTGTMDTSYTQVEPISYLRITFNSDGTGQSDSLGFDPDPMTWFLLNNTTLVLDTIDTLNISLLTANNFNLVNGFTDNSNPPGVIRTDVEFKLTK